MDSKKRQNNFKKTDETGNDGIRHSATSELATESTGTCETSTTAKVAEQTGTLEGNINLGPEGKLMYKAALNGDWKTAEKLLKRNRTLASAEITRTGDTALHMAAAMKRTKFVQELVKWMEPEDLSLPNKGGYSAFCYAAASGIVDIALAMMKRKSNLHNNREAQDEMPPLQMAVLLRNKDMASYLEKETGVEDLSEGELLDLFVDTIRNGMYDVALEILGKKKYLARMQIAVEGTDGEDGVGTAGEDGEGAAKEGTDGEGAAEEVTALHVLAGHNMSDISPIREAILERFVNMFAAFPHLSYVALEVLGKKKCVARMQIARKGTDGEDGEGAAKKVTALHVLAGHNMSDISPIREAILKKLVNMFAAVPYLSWIKRKFEQPLMRKKALSLAEKLWGEMQELEEKKMLELIISPPILLEAAKAGNVEFITMLTRTDPDLIWDTDDDDYTIFHIGVLHRQESVFSLIRQMGAVKYLIATYEDKDGNNILHLAGKLADSSRRRIVSGSALQMQRELMWFKEMEKILPPFCGTVRNKAGLQPREIFSKEHADLLKEGETWMRVTADSCMLIATIMLTVAFTAAFTVPGGNNGNTGIPILLKRSWFEVFLASDAAAMFCATFSIMMFLSILTSRFQEDDFMVSLPLKLLLGLAGLFGSLVGTIFAFTSAYFMIFNVERAWRPMVLGCFACVLLTLVFLSQHFRLFRDTMRSTLGYGHLFRSSKHDLFHIARGELDQVFKNTQSNIQSRASVQNYHDKAPDQV